MTEIPQHARRPQASWSAEALGQCVENGPSPLAAEPGPGRVISPALASDLVPGVRGVKWPALPFIMNKTIMTVMVTDTSRSDAGRGGDPESFLPLTTPEFHVLLALGEDALHGYGMMQSLEAKTGGRDALLPGTLYTTLARMVEKGLLEELVEPPDPDADRRRRYYCATGLGLAVARAEAARLARLLSVAEASKLAPGS